MFSDSQKEQMVKLVKDGKSYQEVADQFSVSRQRVHQIVTGYVSPSSRPMLSGGLDYVREEVRTRDNFTCQMCLKQWIPGERRYDVHHLDERMESIKDIQYDRDNQDKLVTLCHRCHLRLSFLVKRTFEVMGITVPDLPKNQEN